MKKITKIVAGSVLALATLGGVTAIAGHHGFGPHGGHGMMGDFMIYKLEKQLDLDETQVDKLEAIQTFVQEKRAAVSPDDRKAQITALLEQPVLDQQQALTMMDQRIEERRIHAPEMMGKIAAFTDSLTPEQRAELVQMIQDFKPRGPWGKH